MKTLVFVYNANSGLFSALSDSAHKLLSPQTYQCNLCAITHSTFGMRKEWKEFLHTLQSPLEFLHADELRQQYAVADIALPAILQREGDHLEIAVSADAINKCRTMDDLKQLVRESDNPT